MGLTMLSQLYAGVIRTLDWAHMDDGWDHMGDHMGDGGWGMVTGWALFSLLIVALLIWAVWSFVRGSSARSPRNQAMALLDDRFAQGHLSPDEYQERRETLKKR